MTSAVTAFHSQLPVRIAFGDGVIGELPDALSALGAPSALVVVEEPVAGHTDVVAALAAAESAGVRLDRVVKGPGEPTFTLADELAARVRDGALGAVVGIGGGSALDVAKAARIVADQGGGARDYAEGNRTARAAAHRARPLPDDVGHGERGLRRERPHRHRARPEDRLRPPATCARSTRSWIPCSRRGFPRARRRTRASTRWRRRSVRAPWRTRPRSRSRSASRPATTSPTRSGRRWRTDRTPRRAAGSRARASPPASP